MTANPTPGTETADLIALDAEFRARLRSGQRLFDFEIFDLLDRLITQDCLLTSKDKEAKETEEIAERDGYERAVQDIDLLTGGDGEYRASSDPERHTPDPAAMKRRIAERFSSKDKENERLKAERDDALDRVEELESDAEMVSAEFEGDCWKAVRTLLARVGWKDWDSLDSGGMTADMACEIIGDAIYEAEARALSLSTEVEGLRRALEVATETLAEHIYNDWCSQQGWVEWVPHGNSLRQDDARQAARAALSSRGQEGSR